MSTFRISITGGTYAEALQAAFAAATDAYTITIDGETDAPFPFVLADVSTRTFGRPHVARPFIRTAPVTVAGTVRRTFTFTESNDAIVRVAA